MLASPRGNFARNAGTFFHRLDLEMRGLARSKGQSFATAPDPDSTDLRRTNGRTMPTARFPKRIFWNMQSGR